MTKKKDYKSIIKTCWLLQSQPQNIYALIAQFQARVYYLYLKCKCSSSINYLHFTSLKKNLILLLYQDHENNVHLHCTINCEYHVFDWNNQILSLNASSTIITPNMVLSFNFNIYSAYQFNIKTIFILLTFVAKKHY